VDLGSLVWEHSDPGDPRGTTDMYVKVSKDTDNYLYFEVSYENWEDSKIIFIQYPLDHIFEILPKKRENYQNEYVFQNENYFLDFETFFSLLENTNDDDLSQDLLEIKNNIKQFEYLV
jgi:hypothetical protein